MTLSKTTMRLSFFIATLFFSMLTSLLSAQQVEATPSTDFFMSNDKIYVVVASLLIIFIGLSLYILRLDQQLRRLEKKDKD